MQYQKHKLLRVFQVTHLVNLSYYTLKKQYEFSGESHPFWELLYLDKGELIVTAGADQYLLKAGELVFHPPDEFHCFRVPKHTSANIVVLSFFCESSFLSELKRKILSLNQMEKECLTAIARESEACYVHFDNIAPRVDLKKKESAPFGSEQLIGCYLEQLLIHIYRHSDTIRMEERTLAVNQLHHHALLAKQIHDYLLAHVAQPVTLQQLSEQLGISVSQLNRIYRAQTGHSIIEDLINLRIREAKRLIRETNYNFTQIAELTGCDSIYYFSALFKKKTGMTPTEYARSVHL